MAQDKAGYIWIATRGGLSRYDGRIFKNFVHLPYNESTITDNIIESMTIDSHDRLWILYENGVMDLFYTRTEKVVHLWADPAFRLFKEKPIRHGWTHEDAQGNVWIKDHYNGYWLCNPEKHICKHYSGAAMGGSSPEYLIKYSGYNLTYIDGNVIRGANLRNGRYQSNVLYAMPGFIPWETRFRNNGEAVMLYNGKAVIHNRLTKAKTKIAVPEGRIQSMVMNQNGDLYFSIGARIYKIDRLNRFSVFSIPEGSGQLDVQCLLIDKSGNLWSGINADGIKVFDIRLSPLSAYTYQRNFPSDVLTRQLGVPIQKVDSMLIRDAYSLRFAASKNGTLWISSGVHNGKIPNLYQYKDGYLKLPPWKYKNPDAAANPVRPSCFAVSASGKLWGMDWRYRPVYFDTANYSITTYPAFDKPPPHGLVNGMLIDGENVFWLSTEISGLYRYDMANGKFDHYLRADKAGGLPVNTLMNMVNDPRDNNHIWIASLGGGLIRFNKTTRKCQVVTTANGLPDNTIYAVLADEDGLLWCSTNKGLFSYNPVNGHVNIFNTKDGLLDDEYNRFHTIKLPGNRIAFGGFKGYTVFNPRQIFDDEFEPATAITSVRINGVNADAGLKDSPFNMAINNYKKITLPFNQNFLEFNFAGLEYNRPEKLKYRYKLDGYDKTWVYANGAVASYNRLPPGTYTLRLNTANTSGKWSSKVKTLTITIKPPFWLTWWFLLGSAVLLTSFVVLLIRNRLNNIKERQFQLQQQNKLEVNAIELEAQALRSQMNPHFIFNCLNSIKYLIQKNDQHEAINYLTIFSKLIRSQLNNTHREISLAEELHTCKLYLQLEELRFKEKITWRFENQDNVDTYSVMLPPLLLQPFIENAVWHGLMPKTEGGSVIIRVKDEDEFVICEVEDDGVGRLVSMMNKSVNGQLQHQSKGIKLINDRLNLHNAMRNSNCEVTIIDKQGNDSLPAGTLVILKLKKEAA